MKKKLTKALAVLLMLCMLLPQTALAATTYYVDVSIVGPDAKGVEQTVSASSSRYGTKSDRLAATVVSLIKSKKSEISEKFSGTGLNEEFQDGLDAFDSSNGWTAYVNDHFDSVSGNESFKTILSDKTSTLGDLTVGKVNKISYKGYTVTVTLREYTTGSSSSGGSTGGSSSGGSTGTTTGELKQFKDVQPVNHWATESIDYVTSRGLFNGKTEDTFAPEEATTRAQLMTVLARLDGADTTGAALEKGMAWAVANGISDGSNPNAPITRQQLAAMLYRYTGSPAVEGTLNFPDAGSVSDYAKDAMLWATQNGIINGKTDGRLDPAGLATRAQVATMIARYCAKLGV